MTYVILFLFGIWEITVISIMLWKEKQIATKPRQIALFVGLLLAPVIASAVMERYFM